MSMRDARSGNLGRGDLSIGPMPPARLAPRARPALALALIAAAAAACLPGAKPPAAPVRGRLSPEAPRAGAPAEAAGPLRVVFGAPQGETTQGSEVTLVFSKPMRALGLGPHEPPPPVVMTPAAEGSWQWIGSTALRFNAARPLPNATVFRVEVPAGTRALDGSALEEGYALSFSTPRPALSGSEPAAGAAGVAPDAGISLWFTQAVSAEEVARAVSIKAGAAIPFEVKAEQDGGFRLTPKAPLPRASEVKVRVDASLRGAEGELTAGKDAEIAFRTIEPFSVVGWSCAPHAIDARACDPEGGPITLSLSSPVDEHALSRAISIEPKIDIDVWPQYSEGSPAQLAISGEFEPAKEYRLRLRSVVGGKRLVDVYGQPLAADSVQAMRFGDLPSEVTFGASGTYWAGKGPRALPIGTLNVADAVITAAPLSVGEVLSRLGGNAAVMGAAGDGGKRFAPEIGKRNESRWSTVRLEDLLPAGAKGPVLVRAQYGAAGQAAPREASRELQLTNLGLLTRAGREGAAVWVTEISSAQAVAGATVELWHVPPEAAKPVLLASGPTDADGMAALPIGAGKLPAFAGRGRERP
ncbi:MAG: Ig-like domain-containing protein, partial [Polyangiaceae bacterium]|nr:Ig-like domain-containing protein [Polyangiaceae bacterium]